MYNKVIHKYEYKLYSIEVTLIKMYVVKLFKEYNLSKEEILDKTLEFYNEKFPGLKKFHSIYS